MAQDNTGQAPIGQFTFRRTVSGGVTTIDCLDYKLAQTDADDVTTDLSVYADVLTLPQSIRFPGRNLLLHARVIQSSTDCTIDTSGGAPDKSYSDQASGGSANVAATDLLAGSNGKNGKNGEPGSAGKPAGTITIIAGRLDLGGSLKLLARGGDGGHGQGGGDGSKGIKGADSPDDITSGSSPIPRAQEGGRGGNGGDGGEGGRPGDGGDGAEIFLGCVSDFDRELISWNNEGGQPGNPGKPGEPGDGGQGGLGGRIGIGKTALRGGDYAILGPERRASGPAGSKPAKKDGPAPGKAGHAGNDHLTPVDRRGGPNRIPLDYLLGWRLYERRLAFRQTIPVRIVPCIDLRAMANPKQLAMALHKAKLLYLGAKVSGYYEELLALLNWLYHVTADPLSDRRGERAIARLMEANTEFVRFRREAPRTLPAGGLKNQFFQWAEADDAVEKDAFALMKKACEPSIHVSAGTLLAQLAQGLDYYGHPWNYVPVVAFKTYQQPINTFLEAGQSIENLLGEYDARAKGQQNWKDRIESAIFEHQKTVATLEQERAQLAIKRQETQREIAVLVDQVRPKEDSLRLRCEQFVQALRSRLMLDMTKDVFKIVGSIYTAGSMAKAGLQIGSAALKTLTDKEPPTDTPKKPVEIEMVDLAKLRENQKAEQAENAKRDREKSGGDGATKAKEDSGSTAFSNLKSSATAVFDTLDNIKQLVANYSAYSGSYETYGVNANLLVMTEEQFEKLLAPVYQTVGAKAAEYKTAFQAYRAAVRAVQDKVLLYRSQLASEAKLGAEIASSNARIKEIQTQRARNLDPSLDDFRNYLEGLYAEIKLKLLDYLYQQHQALRYWSLQDAPFRPTPDQKIAQLQDAQAKIAADFLEYLSTSRSFPQRFDFELVWKKADHPDLFTSLAAHRQVLLSVQPEDPDIRLALAGKAQVLLEQLSVELRAARTKNRRVFIQIEHTGQTILVDQAGARREFFHDDLDAFYEYQYTDEREIKKSWLGQVIEEKINQVIGPGKGGNLRDEWHIQVSPLTVWSIRLPRIAADNTPLNENLDLTEVNEIVLKFKAVAKGMKTLQAGGRSSDPNGTK